MVHKYKVISFLFFSLTIDFLKMSIDSAFLIPTFRKFSLKDFVLVGSGLMIQAYDDLSK